MRQYAKSLIIILAVLSLPLIAGSVLALTWQIETVDSDGNVGMFTSLVLDASGESHISYYDFTNQRLKYARWDGSAWQIEIVDDDGAVGFYPSLVLDGNGRPHISYYDIDNQNLKYARWDGSAWQIETVDDDIDVGKFSSLALDGNGRPHISYYEDNDALKYAYWNGSAWQIQTVDTTGVVGEYTSLALDSNGRPHITYRDETNLALKYARWDGSAWQIQTVDSNGAVGWDSSLELDGNGRPHVSYYDGGNFALKYAYWDGSAWQIQTVDNDGDVGQYTSLELDGNGRPHISYQEFGEETLKYAYWDGSAWQIETVDSDAGTGWYTSLALDGSGQPHISYYDYGNEKLKYALGGTRALTVVINQAAGQADPTNSSTIHFTVVFNKPVTDFATGDVTLSGTAGATTAVVTQIAPNNGTTYDVAVSGMTSAGTVIATVPAGVASNSGGNNLASTSTDKIVTYDATPPDTTITANPPNPSNSNSASFQFTGNDGSGTGIASFQCQLDGLGYTACTNPKTYNGLSDGSHTFQVQAIDNAGNTDTTPASYTWMVDTAEEPATSNILLSADKAGSVDGVNFGPEDILRFESGDWSLFFDGTAARLTTKHNMNALHVNNANDIYLSFFQNKIKTANLGNVMGTDIIHYNGSNLEWYFDGSDVGLDKVAQEKIDGLHILEGSESPINGGNCDAYLLISTFGIGKVPAAGGGTISFSGEDILGFCATNTGAATSGFWTMVLDGSAEGMPKNSTDSISASDDGETIYLTTKGSFNVDDAFGGHSMIYIYDTNTEEFSGPVFSAPANGLNQKVDGLHVNGDLP